MGSQRCDGCGSKVRIAGGIGDFWSFSNETSGGIDLELADGTDHFLCFACVERLPDDRDVTAADVRALGDESDERGERDESDERDAGQGNDDTGEADDDGDGTRDVVASDGPDGER